MNAESDITKIPLSQLRISPRNMRKTGGAAIDDLAASILSHKLLQNLTVSQADDGCFEVEAGGRRLRALQKLAADKKVPDDMGIPCRVVTQLDAAEASLAENQLREAMHPADQFLAIKALVDADLSESEVAARFGATPLFIRQRMKLAKVSPKIIDDYRAGKTTLDVVEACAITDDIPRQERAYKQNRHHAYGIRRALTQGEVQSTDRRVEFIGLAAYEAAGGPTHKDLFDEDGVTYLRDAALLDRLVAEKLEAEAEKVRAEGWGWVEAAPEINTYNFPHHHEAKGDKSKFGALVHINYGGKIGVERWRMKPGQRAGKSAPDKKAAKSGGDLSQDMVRRLELHRAAAIREAVAATPAVALRMLLFDMLSQLNMVRAGGGIGYFDASVQLSNNHQDDGGLANDKFTDLKASPARKAMSDRVQRLQEQLKAAGKTPTIEWLASLTTEAQLELLALCFALTIERNGGKTGTALADALGIDMAKWWVAGPDTFFSVVPKAVLVSAVVDIAGKPAGEKVLAMKKDAAIAETARQLDGTGWLPKQLRGAHYQLRKGATSKPAAKANTAPAKKAAKKPAKKAKPKKLSRATVVKAPARKKSR